MNVSKHTAEERIQEFLDAFHHTSNLAEWPHMRVDKIVQVHFRVRYATGVLQQKQSPLTYRDAMFTGSLFRKYLSPKEPVYLPDVVRALREVGVQGATVDEAESQFDQTVEDRFEFITDRDAGESVGLIMDELKNHGLSSSVRWEASTNLTDPRWSRIFVSTRDATEVFFNEGALHAFAPKRNEAARRVIRSAPAVFQTFLAHVAVAATVYASALVHMALNDSGHQRWKCSGAFCQERKILDEVRSAVKSTTADD